MIDGELHWVALVVFSRPVFVRDRAWICRGTLEGG